jgi:nucleotide-binding universal stress UspA family protein
MSKQTIVGYDGSGPSLEAVMWAAHHASVRGTPLRARAGRSGGWAPAVGPFDEFDGDHECDGECDLVESVMDEAVGVAA